MPFNRRTEAVAKVIENRIGNFSEFDGENDFGLGAAMEIRAEVNLDKPLPRGFGFDPRFRPFTQVKNQASPSFSLSG